MGYPTASLLRADTGGMSVHRFVGDCPVFACRYLLSEGVLPLRGKSINPASFSASSR